MVGNLSEAVSNSPGEFKGCGLTRRDPDLTLDLALPAGERRAVWIAGRLVSVDIDTLASIPVLARLLSSGLLAAWWRLAVMARGRLP
jgi:hypothetical protein